MFKETRWLTGAALGVIVSVALAELVMALLALAGSGEHLLASLARPDVAATTRPALIAVIWMIAVAAGGALACAWCGRPTAAIPAAMLPAAALLLVTWYFAQPALVAAMVIAGPVIGSACGCALAMSLQRRDLADQAGAVHNGPGI